jgi:hypothetical protein
MKESRKRIASQANNKRDYTSEGGSALYHQAMKAAGLIKFYHRDCIQSIKFNQMKYMHHYQINRQKENNNRQEQHRLCTLIGYYDNRVTRRLQCCYIGLYCFIQCTFRSACRQSHINIIVTDFNRALTHSSKSHVEASSILFSL